MYALDGSRFVQGVVYVLESGSQRQEARAHRRPQLYDNNYRHHVRSVGQPLFSRIYNSQIHEHGVEVSVRVAREHELPDYERRRRHGGGVEHEGEEHLEERVHLVYEPCQDEAQNV